MILIGTQDFGPAKYLYEITKGENNFIWAYNANLKNFFNENKISTIKKWKNLTNIELVVTGTCLQNGIDKQVLIWSKTHKIKSISCIEHWTNIKERFKYKKKIIYPNFIILNDKFVYAQAIKEGLPQKKLYIGGNPIIEKFLKLKDYKSKNKINKKKKKILFISESLNYFKKNKNNHKGYNEYQVLNIILNSMSKEFSLTIKKHPSEREIKYINYKKKFGINETKVADPLKLLNKYDYFIGMESMLLIQLSFISNYVISIRPNSINDFIPISYNLMFTASNSKELEIIINSSSLKKKNKNKNLKQMYISSSKKIKNFIENQST